VGISTDYAHKALRTLIANKVSLRHPPPGSSFVLYNHHVEQLQLLLRRNLNESCVCGQFWAQWVNLLLILVHLLLSSRFIEWVSYAIQGQQANIPRRANKANKQSPNTVIHVEDDASLLVKNLVHVTMISHRDWKT
jgi:hypothetical protein